MNQVPEEKKDSVTKTLAILGFVAAIILIVWLAVKVVALIPSAFSSLASIADSVYTQTSNKELVVTTKNSVVNTGEAFEVSWSEMGGNGSYDFAYKCTDGVSLDIRKNGGVETVECNTVTNLGEENTIDVLINTEKQRFTDVEYAVYYRQEGAEDVVTNSVITVVNPSIPTGAIVETDDTTQTNHSDTVATTNTKNTDNQTTTQTNTGSKTTTGGKTTTTYTPTYQPRYVKQYTYQLPVSDPNGHIDLAIRHLGVGTIKNGHFIPLGELDEDEVGAIRFEITNQGTKTAASWGYEAELPSGPTYDSGLQKPLKPKESVVLTLAYDNLHGEGIERFGVVVNAAGDVNRNNNGYEWAVEVTD